MARQSRDSSGTSDGHGPWCIVPGPHWNLEAPSDEADKSSLALPNAMNGQFSSSSDSADVGYLPSSAVPEAGRSRIASLHGST
ncbi:hypothetical protein DCS_03283 [Drechmeria coniospora]|uniref:Uncharacterized protein n=1 Tax=Drechmeria coniospora TaxID=98403 RepID=A0A151GYF9_DRECN|nr:hypothetical protein DCS_03283 [Drechmeria coniospora]KYK62136.1 hypothetical protein DCS_03283 [Drechmeria coniospora]